MMRARQFSYSVEIVPIGLGLGLQEVFPCQEALDDEEDCHQAADRDGK